MKAFCFGFFLLTVLNVSTGQNEIQSINTFLQDKVAAQELTSSDIQDWKFTDEHISSISGVHHLYYRQRYNGLEVYGANASAHFLPDGSELKMNNAFVKDLETKISGGSSPSLSAVQAVISAASQMGYPIIGNFMILEEDAVNNEYLISKGSASLEDIPAKLIYAPDGNQYVLAWNIAIYELSAENWWEIRVDAHTGQIIDKNNWVTTCDWGNNESLIPAHLEDHSSHHHSIEATGDDKKNNSFMPMVGSYNVFALPLQSPLYGPRTVVTNPDDPVASPFGWHDTNGVAGSEFTDTRGNNVDAFEDGDNAGFRPDGGGGLSFNFPLTEPWSPGNQSEAASITNLFYWNNIIHDITYQYGFDEASGNFQVNNYGNGGVGGDAVNARAQITTFCNATFGTPPDGSSGTMSMYICGIGNNDGDFDNMVVVHEYAHGISNRLTGGAGNTSCLNNSEQMGEGWSDYYGIALTMQAAHTATTQRTAGNYLFGQNAAGPGIRPFPYTTDMLVNPQTYNSIIGTGSPHALGVVWTIMLWEMTWELINVYGFDPDFYNGTGGNNIALALVTEGMKLQPCSPGFVDGRDAILAADIALYGGANQCAIWTAFAKRGLGQFANQGSPFDRNDGTEDFTVPAAACGGCVPVTVVCPPADLGTIGCNDPIPPAATTIAEFTALGGTVMDGCPPIDISHVDDLPAGGVCGNGVLTRTYTITDLTETIECVQTLNINGPQPPTVVCPPDMTVACEADIVVDATNSIVTTDCGLGFVQWVDQPHITGARDCDGTTYEYTYHAVDDCGNIGSCIQTWTLSNAAPTIAVIPGGTVGCFEDIVVSEGDATVTTSCGEELDITIYPPVINGESDCPGTTYTYTYRVEDQCEREATADRVFTIGAGNDPVVTAPDNVTCECLAGVNPYPHNASVETSCGVDADVTVSGPVISGPIDCPGTTYTYTYTGTDACDRTGSDAQTFTVSNGPPVFDNCPENCLILNCEDEGWEDIIQAWLASVTAKTSCGQPLTVFNNYNPNAQGVCISNGTTNVTWRATDQCGRQSTCSSMIIINDTEPPHFVEEAQDELDICNYNTPHEFDAWVDAHGNSLALDGCDQNITSNQWSTIPNNPSINCNGAMGPTSVTVTFVVRDDCGNKSSSTATFTALMAGGDIVEDGDGPAEATTVFRLNQNQPNPFSNETVISFTLPTNASATLTIYDLSGKVVKLVQGEFSQGYNEIQLSRSELSGAGMLYYELSTATDNAVKKMIIVD